jgi:peptidoglycan/LPS O-acetylase OafA/YrhL
MSESELNLVLIIFALIVGSVTAVIKVRRLNSRKHINDELVVRINERAASIAYSFSFLSWLIIVTCINAEYFPLNPALYIGIIIMPVSFGLARLYFHFIGIKDEK